MNDPLTSLILELAHALGVSPITAAAMIPIIMMLSNLGARLIPDTATGGLKFLRIVLSIVGAHAKDNTGVAGVMNQHGDVIRRTPMDTVPEPIQGALILDDSFKPDPFGRGANALNKNQLPDSMLDDGK